MMNVNAVRVGRSLVRKDLTYRESQANGDWRLAVRARIAEGSGAQKDVQHVKNAFSSTASVSALANSIRKSMSVT